VSIWTTIPAHVVTPPNAPVVSVGNLKGGVGKTTVVSNLAIALVQAGMRVLAIDLDFQASLSVAVPPGVVPRREVANGGVHALLSESYDMFHDDRITAVGVGKFADLSLVRTSLDLADVEDKLFAAFFLGSVSRIHALPWPGSCPTRASSTSSISFL
jgi:cellulose biosynthesis protein BcsQ